MSQGMEQLQALLSKDGRELINIKFFPANGKNVTEDELAKAAVELLEGDPVDNPPVSGIAKASI